MLPRSPKASRNGTTAVAATWKVFSRAGGNRNTVGGEDANEEVQDETEK